MIQEYFILALNLLLADNRTTTVGPSNLYLKNFTIPQIELYNLLSHELPQVAMPTIIGHDVVLNEVSEKSEISIIDIGVGTGQQTLKFLEKLKGSKVQKVTVVGIEPTKESLEQAKSKFNETKFPFEVTFIGINNLFENLTAYDLEVLSCQAPNPIIWASFAFHHVKSDRTAELARIKSFLNPSLIVLLEPNVDHFTNDFGRRYFNCFNHFKMTFDVIDLLDLNPNQNESLKLFFAREILDIVSKDDFQRTERHEPVSSWISRLEEAGFSTFPIRKTYANKIIQIKNNPTHVSLEFNDFPLTSVIVAK